MNTTVFTSRSTMRLSIALRWVGYSVLVGCLGCSRTPVAELAAKLTDADHDVRYEAAKKLEEYGPEAAEAAPALAAALSDPVSKVRYRSAKALSKIGIGASAAAEELAAALQKPTIQPKTRYYIVKTLANIEDAAIVALPELIATLQKKEDVKTRYFAAKALGKIGPEAQTAVGALEQARKDSDRKLRKAATEALVKVRRS